MHCWACGTTLLEDSNFCHRCGARVRRQQASEAAKSVGAGTSPPEQAEAASSPAEAPRYSPPAEAEVWVGRPTIGSLAGRFTFAGVCLLAIIGGLAYIWQRKEIENWQPLLWRVALVLLVILGLWLLVSVIKTKLTLRYRLTTERLIIERGFLSKRTEELDLLRVDEATVHQGLFDRLANVGNIVIASTEPTDPLHIIVGVEQPVELKEKVRQQTRELRRLSVPVNGGGETPGARTAGAGG
jgi:membrane protein YdbS with pleckstrin-like domain